MESSLGVPRILVSVDENNLLEGAQKILETIRPFWKTNDIRFKLLTDGITNKLVGCSVIDGDEKDTVLVRVYGNKTDLLIDRKAETRNIILLNKVGLAPSLYGTFNNGLVYGYVPGCTLDEKTVTNQDIYKLVAVEMSKLHQVEIPDGSTRESFLWKKIDMFLDLVPDQFTDKVKHKRYEEMVIPKEKIVEEVKFLKSKLVGLKSPIVFSHNDLLLKNIIYTEESESVTFIDYEYAAYNYQAFDIGNHFAEFAGVSEVDYTRYPDKEFQWKWLRTYLSRGEDIEVSESDIERLYVQVNQFMLIAHVFWGIWALIQAEHSYIDFDFIEYGALRLNEYLSKKEECLALEMPH